MRDDVLALVQSVLDDPCASDASIRHAISLASRIAENPEELQAFGDSYRARLKERSTLVGKLTIFVDRITRRAQR